jgi:hypothetical protein
MSSMTGARSAPTAMRQFNGLADVGLALEMGLDKPVESLWHMQVLAENARLDPRVALLARARAAVRKHFEYKTPVARTWGRALDTMFRLDDHARQRSPDATMDLGGLVGRQLRHGPTTTEGFGRMGGLKCRAIGPKK